MTIEEVTTVSSNSQPSKQDSTGQLLFGEIFSTGMRLKISAQSTL